MIIRCPNCNARYTLTAQQIGEHGRTMRCAKCSHTWFQPPVEDEQGPVSRPGKPPLPPQTSTEQASKLPAPTPVLAMLATAASVVVLVIGGSLWWFLSQQNTTNVPANYSPVAMNTGNQNQVHTDTGLVLSHIERDIVEDNNVTVLLFRGRVTNTNAVTTPVPEIRVQLLNKKGVELDFWPAEVAKEQLEPGEEASWVVRFLNPPLDDIAQYKAFFKTY